MSGSAMRVYNYCKNSPVPCKCFNNCPFVCNQSSIIFDPSKLRVNALFNIYCKLIATNLPNVTQQDLVNYTAGTNAQCTVFVRTLDGNGNSVFTRQYTTLRDITTGTYVVGTTLDTSSDTYDTLVLGDSVQIFDVLFGQSYESLYWKINNKYYASVHNCF